MKKPANEAATDPIEETKEESVYMYGTPDEVKEDVFRRLDGVDMNMLESGLLKRLLADPAGNRQMIEQTLLKLQTKH